MRRDPPSCCTYGAVRVPYPSQFLFTCAGGIVYWEIEKPSVVFLRLLKPVNKRPSAERLSIRPRRRASVL